MIFPCYVSRFFQRVPCANRTRLSSLDAWHLCRSAKGTCGPIEAEAVWKQPRSLAIEASERRAVIFELLSSCIQLPQPEPSTSLIGRRPGLASGRMTSIELRWQESNLRRDD